jgi:nucleotide-binding universal stress UspA family protein
MTETETSAPPTGVVVGVDTSPNASIAAEWAACEAFSRGVRLALVHALGLPDASAHEPSEYALRSRERGRTVLDGIAGCLRSRFPDLQVDTVLSDLPPARALHALSASSELMVTGTRGHGGFPGMALGSVSRKVAAHARCPLVVVPGEPPRERQHNDVVVGVEPGQADAPLTYAFAAAARYGATLHAMRVWRPRWSPPGIADELPADLAETHAAEEKALETLLEPFRAGYPKVDVRIMAWRGNTVPTLIQAAFDSRLLVIGSHHHRGPLAVGAGYVVDGVLAHSPTAVAVVPV